MPPSIAAVLHSPPSCRVASRTSPDSRASATPPPVPGKATRSTDWLTRVHAPGSVEIHIGLAARGERTPVRTIVSSIRPSARLVGAWAGVGPSEKVAHDVASPIAYDELPATRMPSRPAAIIRACSGGEPADVQAKPSADSNTSVRETAVNPAPSSVMSVTADVAEPPAAGAKSVVTVQSIVSAETQAAAPTPDSVRTWPAATTVPSAVASAFTRAPTNSVSRKVSPSRVLRRWPTSSR